MSASNSVMYLKSLKAVRERSYAVYERAQAGGLQHFELSEDKIEPVADYVLSLIERDFGSIASVPPHGRWRSYCVPDAESPTGKRDLVGEHVAQWQASDVSEWECARRVIDLFVVSVLIDAGAGSKWRYRDSLGTLERTEGLGVAALRMFEKGVFSSNPKNPFQADAQALLQLTDKDIRDGFQVSDDNPLLGCENRAELLRSLGRALSDSSRYYGGKCVCSNHPARPGFMLDYLSGCTESSLTVSIDDIWDAIIDGLAPVWPASRTQLDGVSLGDVWPCPVLSGTPGTDDAQQATSPSCLVPFHKLSQWLTWSLLEAIVKLAKFTVTDTEKLTGLPEYRNGGLLVDMGVLSLKDADRERGLVPGSTIPQFEGSDPVIVEWRAMTVVLLDKVAEIVRQKCGLPEDSIPDMFLARVLEGGTWKAGRELAAKLRGDTKDPPINIVSDGTLF
ncbi:hypothetical protein LPJ61_004657 [Coemansia biformis]|uniref:DUF1688-domain-containing protein n=1 Tax=Coemansia biformis TaxID=1286918 RepID=A0A9W7Y4F7_9FUNG|nr:hypothetical protein LPJ61_004657 [Coemansia biformis]